MMTETKVGIVFFLGLGVALWFTLFVSEVNGGLGEFEIRFNRVVRIESGDKVSYNGVDVGRVKSVVPVLVDGRSMVAVSFDIPTHLRSAVLINEETVFTITEPFFGPGQLEILGNGTGRAISPEAMDELAGTDPVNVQEILREVAGLVRDNRENLKVAVAKLPVAIESVAGMGTEIEAVVKENRKAVGAAIVNFRDMSGSIKKLATDNEKRLATALDGFNGMSTEIKTLVAENKKDIRTAVAKLPTVAENAAQAAADLRDMIKRNSDNIDKVAKGMADFIPKLDSIGNDIKAVTSQIAQGEGTVGKLVFDDSLYRTTTGAMTGIEQRVEEVEPFTSAFARMEFYGGVDTIYNVSSGASYSHAYVRIEPTPDKFYLGGASYRSGPSGRADEFKSYNLDQFVTESALFGPEYGWVQYVYREDQNRENPDRINIDLDLLFGMRFLPDDDIERYRLSVAGGLIEGQLGGMASYALTDRMDIWVMGRGKSNSRDEFDRRYEEGAIMGRLGLDYRVWRGLTLTVGGDDLVDDPAPMVGVKAELLDQDIRNLFQAATLF